MSEASPFEGLRNLTPATLAGLAFAAITAVGLAASGDEHGAQFEDTTRDLIHRQAATVAILVTDLARMCGHSEKSLLAIMSDVITQCTDASTTASNGGTATSPTDPPSTIE